MASADPENATRPSADRTEITMASPKKTLRELKAREREVRRDLIVDAARKAFGKNTYDKVSMQEIARAAGIAKSSIYTYFKNQEALFVEATYRDTTAFINALEAELDKAAGAPLAALVERFITFCTENEVYWKMITRFSLYGEISDESSRKLDVVARRFMDLLDMVFAHAAATLDQRLLSHSLFAALSGVLIAFRKYPGRTDAQSLAHMLRVGRLITDMFDVYLQHEAGGAAPATKS
jgi:AcrR family transcriptional regulator